ATLDDMGVIRVWSPDGRLFARGRPPSYRVTLLLFTSNDRLLAWRSDDPFTMDLRATADSTLGATLLLDRSSTPALAYSRDHVVTETRVFGDGFNRPEQLVVLASEDADTVARIAVPEFTGQLDLAPDGGSLAFERRPGEIAVLELPSARGVANIPAGAEVYGLSLADGPAAVTTVLRGGVVRLWRLDRGTVREVPVDTTTRAEEAFLSPAGDHLVIPGGNVVAVHDARTGRPIARLLHDTDVDRIRFAADTAILVTIASGRVHIWELDTGRLVAELGGDTYYRDVAFLNHDRDLLTVDADGYAVVRVWRTEDVLRAACDQLDAPLSPAEWAEYLPGEPYRPVCAR
ncbi:MAG: WD40 repeat domain-containing protein, partial [Longimicrobiales bacterium]